MFYVDAPDDAGVLAENYELMPRSISDDDRDNEERGHCSFTEIKGGFCLESNDEKVGYECLVY